MALRSSGPPSRDMMDYHLERGGTQLHDTFVVNSKRGVTTENQGVGAWYIG